MMDVSRMAYNCPYCGGSAVLYNHHLKTIECESCTRLSVSSETISGAVSKWNKNVRLILESDLGGEIDET